MEDIYDLTGGASDDPHRHSYYIVMLVKRASGKHIIDFNEFDLEDNQLYFVSPGQVHQLVEKSKSYGYVMTFSREFLTHNDIAFTLIDDLALFLEYGQSPPMLLNTLEVDHLENYINQMIRVAFSKSRFTQVSLTALFKLFLVQCNTLKEAKSSGELQRPVPDKGKNMVRMFKELLNTHHQEWHQVKEYAKALNISTSHFTTTIKHLTGSSPKDHISARIITAAKRLLIFSEKTTKEISYELGFQEPSNFSLFFKKHTGFSPSKFCDDVHKKENI